MAENQEQRFIQNVAFNGEQFDLSMMVNCAYIETLDMSGPQLIIEFNDQDAKIADELGLREKDIITVAIVDIENREELDIETEFQVQTMPKKGDLLTLNCFQKDLAALKARATETQLFSGVSVDAIIKQLAPDMVYDIDRVPVTLDYHLLSGDRPSRLFRQIARENASVCYLSRGTVCFKPITSLLYPEPAFEYEFNNIEAERHIIDFTMLNDGEMMTDGIRRRYAAFDEKSGLMTSKKYKAGAIEMVPTNHGPILDNLSAYVSNQVELIMEGNGGLTPGKTLRLIWNMYKEDFPLDESLPSKICITTVSHFTFGSKYICKVKGYIG